MKASDQTVLSLHKKKIITLDRIKITHDEHRTWTLRIERVQREDAGVYSCEASNGVGDSARAELQLQVPVYTV